MLSTCQIPWMSGCPLDVFGGVYAGMLAGAWADAGEGASERAAMTVAEAIIVRISDPLFRVPAC